VTYNGQTQSQTGAALSGFLPGDQVQAAGLAQGRHVGTYGSALTATGADVQNYNISFHNAPLTIGKKAASLSSLDQSVVYNGLNQQLSGTQNSGFIAGDALSFNGLPSGRDVGQYTSALTVSGADAGNYEITVGNGKLTITPKEASVKALDESVVYNGNIHKQSTYEQQGFIAGDAIVVSGLASGRNAGIYSSDLKISGADAKNYAVRLQQGNLSVQKARLSFTGTSAADKLADGTTVAQVKAGSIVGLVGTETLAITSVRQRRACGLWPGQWSERGLECQLRLVACGGQGQHHSARQLKLGCEGVGSAQEHLQPTLLSRLWRLGWCGCCHRPGQLCRAAPQDASLFSTKTGRLPLRKPVRIAH
jgi:hypothetical protein